MRPLTWLPEITFSPASSQLYLRQRMPISIIWTAKNRPSPLPSRALPPAFPASWKAAISSRSSWRTILSAVALMEADSVLQLASCDLKSVGYLSSQLPLLGELKWDKDKQYRVASNIKPFQAADRIGQVLGSVVFRLPYSQELEEQYLAGELLADLSMKDSRAFRKEINRICEEVF